ncbi:hypothetical protein SDJN03_04558, partial [Cucurbita argyrosperma subsp. sororia]
MFYSLPVNTLRFIYDAVHSNLNCFSRDFCFKVEVTVVNVSTRRQNGIESLDDFFFVSRDPEGWGYCWSYRAALRQWWDVSHILCNKISSYWNT